MKGSASVEQGLKTGEAVRWVTSGRVLRELILAKKESIWEDDVEGSMEKRTRCSIAVVVVLVVDIVRSM